MARPKLTNEYWHKLSNILRQINIYTKPNLRLTVEAMLYRIRLSCPWRDLPPCFGNWSIINTAIGVKQVSGKNLWQS